jgi:murein DD-endopeptidase MepM/ murein hydrolase activator NlpD
MIEHPRLAGMLGYPKLFSQYAHLLHPCVEEGKSIWAGEPVGSIGKGDPSRPFAAHLHFEIRRAALPPDHWPGSNKAAIQRDYLDPEVFLKRYMAYERRYIRDGAMLYLPGGSCSVPGEVVVNLDDPSLAHVRMPSTQALHRLLGGGRP